MYEWNGLVSGHDFSRAENGLNYRGLQPLRNIPLRLEVLVP
jgi:hypothetical protein